MIRRELLRGSLALAVLLTGCGVFGRDLPTYRYRLTVEVDTPEGLKRGSSVIEVRTAVAGSMKLPDANALAIRVTGEAVAVDLGKRGLLFALLRREAIPQWAGGVMELVTQRPPHDPDEDDYVAWHAAMIANKGLHVIPRNSLISPRGYGERMPTHRDPPADYPMLVRFGDIADPTSVARVDPDDLAAPFGKGVKLRRITVELTDDFVTTGIEMRLKWLPNHRGQLISATIADSLEARALSSITEGDFVKDDLQ